MRTGARDLRDRLEKRVDFGFNMHNENTIPKWEGEDYFVMVCTDIGYFEKRDALRLLVIDWIAANRPDQIKNM